MADPLKQIPCLTCAIYIARWFAYGEYNLAEIHKTVYHLICKAPIALKIYRKKIWQKSMI